MESYQMIRCVQNGFISKLNASNLLHWINTISTLLLALLKTNWNVLFFCFQNLELILCISHGMFQNITQILIKLNLNGRKNMGNFNFVTNSKR